MGAPRHPYTAALLASVLTPDPALGLPTTRLGTAFPNPLAVPSGCVFHPRCPAVFDRCPHDAPALLPCPEGGRAACHLVEQPEGGPPPPRRVRAAAA